MGRSACRVSLEVQGRAGCVAERRSDGGEDDPIDPDGGADRQDRRARPRGGLRAAVSLVAVAPAGAQAQVTGSIFSGFQPQQRRLPSAPAIR